jgi:hypothetical protein
MYEQEVFTFNWADREGESIDDICRSRWHGRFNRIIDVWTVKGNTFIEAEVEPNYDRPEPQYDAFGFEIETYDDMLGYDADHGDPSQYCKHGTWVGSWAGPDYMCSRCELGDD